MARPYHNLASYHYQKIGDMNKAMAFYKMSLTKKYLSPEQDMHLLLIIWRQYFTITATIKAQ